jgi:hypothetical protein
MLCLVITCAASPLFLDRRTGGEVCARDRSPYGVRIQNLGYAERHKPLVREELAQGGG